MSKVVKMSLKEIINEINLIMREKDIIYICDDIDVVKQFIEIYENGPKNRDKMKQLLIDNEKHIDKEKYVLMSVKNYKENIKVLKEFLEKLKKELVTDSSKEKIAEIGHYKNQLDHQREYLAKAIKLGKGIEDVLSQYVYDEVAKRYKVLVIDSREYIDGKRISTTKELKRFDEIDASFRNKGTEKIGLEYVIQSLLLTDLYEAFPNQHFGDDIRTMILENEIIRRKLKTREQLEFMKMKGTYEKYIELIDSIKFEGLLPDIKLALREYAQYIDMDKLLLISAYRFYEALENDILEPDACVTAKEILINILKNIKNKNLEIHCQLQDKINETYELEDVSFSVNDIKKCISRFAGNIYLKEEEIEEYRKQINGGEISLREIQSELVDVLFSDSEVEKLSKISIENFIYVYKRNNWDIETIIDLYEKDEILLSDFAIIKEEIELPEEMFFENLNTYYNLKNENIEDTQIEEKYKKFLELYKEIFLSGKSLEEIQEISDEIMGRLVELLEKEKYNQAVKDYFRDGLLTIDTIAQWSNEKFIIELLNENLINYDTLINLVKENKISEKDLNGICNIKIYDSEIEYTERLKLIKTGLISEDNIINLYNKNLLFEQDFEKLAEEGYIRKQIMQRAINARTLEELEKSSSIRLMGLNTLTKKNNDIYSYGGSINNQLTNIISTGKIIIDPNVRKEFIMALGAYNAFTDLKPDSPFYNYEFYVIPDGDQELGLNSVVIAERYYQDKDTETRFATNNATYFFKYKDLMVLSNLKKSEMTQERENVVFTANHVLATEKREGYWAKGVLAALVKTMLSSGLKGKSSKEQRKIIKEKLEEMYTKEELKDILDFALEIDFGQYNGEIEMPEKMSRKRKNSSSRDGEDR